MRTPLAPLTLAIWLALAGTGLVATPVVLSTVATAQTEALQEEGQAAVMAWIEAVASGDPEKVRAVSAPEFQIVRGDGSARDLDGYLTHLPVLEEVPEMENVVVTRTGEQMVVRYTVDVFKDVEGKTVEADGPRLTVLRLQDGTWLVVAHSNFAAVLQE